MLRYSFRIKVIRCFLIIYFIARQRVFICCTLLIQVLRYELLDVGAPPLNLATYWKLEKENTDLRIDYHLNPNSPLQNALLNLTFSTKVNGGVTSVTANPKEEW